MIHSKQTKGDYDNRNSLLDIGKPLHEEKNTDKEAKEILLIKAKDEQALRYFKALREIEFLMVRI